MHLRPVVAVVTLRRIAKGEEILIAYSRRSEAALTSVPGHNNGMPGPARACFCFLFCFKRGLVFLAKKWRDIF
jgi:hypothetical protein